MSQYSKVTNQYSNTNQSIFEVVMTSDSHGKISDGIGGTLLDAFGRIRVSNPHTLFDSFGRFEGDMINWDTANTANSTVVFNTNQGCIDLTTDTTMNTEIVRETKRVFPYQPGKSLLIMNSFNFANPKANLQQRVGYFSSNNGIFLEQSDLTTYIVLRNIGSGIVVDNRISQTDWNFDKFDGSGPSNILLDITKSQILWTDIEWLGAGKVRVGFIINGRMHVAHEFVHGNVGLETYMQTACLPIRYEIKNTGTTATPSTFHQICSAITSEGGYTQITTTRSISNSLSGRTLTQDVKTPVMAIRLRSGRCDAIALPVDLNLYGIQAVAYKYYIIRDVSSITGGTWTQLEKSSVEYSNNSTTITGGTIVHEGIFRGQESTVIDLRKLYGYALQLSRKINAANGDVFVIAVEPTTTNDVCISSISWEEQTI